MKLAQLSNSIRVLIVKVGAEPFSFALIKKL
jgi:hypothetical protein